MNKLLLFEYNKLIREVIDLVFSLFECSKIIFDKLLVDR